MRKIKTLSLIGILYILTLYPIIQPKSEDKPSAKNDEFPAVNGSYFGQKPPGSEPHLFAPGVISREDYFEHSAAVFSPDLREVYWSAKPNNQRFYNIYFMKIIDGRWTMPEVVPFLNKNFDERGPVFSPDGNKLYFNLNGDIWTVEKRGDKWSDPALISELSDPYWDDRVCGVTKDGSVFLTRSKSTPRIREIYVLRFTNGDYLDPERLNKDIPSGYKAVGDIFVAPDESYMILELHIDESTSELFVSYKMNDGSWSDEINLMLGWGRCPSVSPDGKYIFFMRREGIYWVNSGILQKLKPAEAK